MKQNAPKELISNVEMKAKLFGCAIANKIKVMFNRKILAKRVRHVGIFCHIGLQAFKVITVCMSISVSSCSHTMHSQNIIKAVPKG